MTKRAQLHWVAGMVSLVGASACLRTDFDPPSVLDSVRILASKADKPYAKPGDQIEIEVLAVDGRPSAKTPMTLYWIPAECINPPRDLYYVCFAYFFQKQTVDATSGPPLRPGTDLTSFLPRGPKYSFKMPADVISSHTPTPGAPAPFGLAILFNIACAGRVKLEEPSTDNPQNVPLGCYDDQDNRLGPEDFMVGFTRVYAYEGRTNANPVIARILFDGKEVGDQGIEVDHCTKEKFSECDTKDIDVDIPGDSWELNDLSKDFKGNPQHEAIWSTWYSTIGRFDSEVRLHYDASSGRVDESRNKLKIPREVGKGPIWVVVRDNRGGTAWKEIPFSVK